MRRCALAAFALPALGFNAQGPAVSTLQFDAEAAKNRPVSKVVNLLKDMMKQLEKEAEEDEEIYDKLACWCETNDKEKNKSIKDAEAKIKDLTVSIEELTAQSARLSAEIKNLKKEVQENQDALDSATAIRQKELAEFNAEEKELLVAIQNLKNAVIVLSKVQGGASFLQSGNVNGVANLIAYQMTAHAQFIDSVLSVHQRDVLSAFVQSPQDYFDAEPTFKQSYAAQSGEIFGILNQMKESFETNLAETQKDEAANVASYEDLKAAKEEEIQAGISQIETKTDELATTDEKLAEAKEDIEDTKNSLTADEEFLMMLKEKCSVTDAEWEERQKTRQQEIEACSKALAVLSSDEAHDLFTKTFNPAFVQKAERSHSERRAQASKVLMDAAKKLGKPQLSAIAMKVKLDAFEKVKKAIDDMVAQLLIEKKDEIKHKDFCVEEFNTNQLQTERKESEKADLIALIEDLTLTIKTLGQEIDTLKSEVATMNRQMKAAGEERDAQNKEFQQVVADSRASQALLKKALDVLKGFYEKESLLQKGKAGPPPPPSFKEYKKNAAAGGVMGMIQEIIDDAKEMEAEATRAEGENQAAYEQFVKDTNASIEEKTKEMVNKAEEKAKAEGDLNQAETDKEAALLELEELSNYNAELHQECDFVMKNFEIRQTARDEEIEALKQAKSILSGAKFAEFLQAR